MNTLGKSICYAVFVCQQEMERNIESLTVDGNPSPNKTWYVERSISRTLTSNKSNPKPRAFLVLLQTWVPPSCRASCQSVFSWHLPLSRPVTIIKFMWKEQLPFYCLDSRHTFEPASSFFQWLELLVIVESLAQMSPPPGDNRLGLSKVPTG